MDVGIGLPSTIPGAGGERTLEWARRAEARGFSALGTIDRIVYPSQEPLIALAAAAGATERIRLMTAILLAPTRPNGAVLAKQAATLDLLSGGRLVLGVAVGRREDDFTAAGADFRARGRVLDEMLELWDGIWSGDEIGPHGRPSVLLGGWADAAFTRAARHADGWTGGNCTLEELADGTGRLRAAWEAAGRDGAPRIVVQPYYALGDGAERAVDHTLRDYYGDNEYTDGIVARAATDAETVRENVKAFAAAGCDELIFFPCDPDPEQVDLLADALR
jgi:alkanesulfonate monooxygenase SsuD/methylene tetrahydromethanopterin reductase-like flavin-dependent oxidoreductase (luciferase family)